MKILYLNHNFQGEGTYFRAFNFARNLASFGHDMTLITVSPSSNFRAKRYVKDGVHIIEAPKFMDQHRGGWSPVDTLFKTGHVLKHKYDIIHGFDHKPNVSFPVYAHRLFRKRAVIFSDWADWWTKGGISSASRLTPEIMIETFLEESIRKTADRLTVTSRVLRERALSLGIPSKNIFYIPSGCDTDNIKPASKTAVYALRKKLGIPARNIVFEFIGFGQGDVDLLVEAFNYAAGRMKNINFLIVGPLDRIVAEKISASPYKDRIISTGRVPYSRIPACASAADICLLPLRDNKANRARGPIKAGDYMAAGRPVIANPVGDIKYFIDKYKIGMTAGFSPENFGGKMMKLAKDKKLMSRFSRSSLKTARAELSWKTLSAAMEKAYIKTLKELR